MYDIIVCLDQLTLYIVMLKYMKGSEPKKKHTLTWRDLSYNSGHVSDPSFFYK